MQSAFQFSVWVLAQVLAPLQNLPVSILDPHDAFRLRESPTSWLGTYLAQVCPSRGVYPQLSMVEWGKEGNYIKVLQGAQRGHCLLEAELVATTLHVTGQE